MAYCETHCQTLHQNQQHGGHQNDSQSPLECSSVQHHSKTCHSYKEQRHPHEKSYSIYSDRHHHNHRTNKKSYAQTSTGSSSRYCSLSSSSSASSTCSSSTSSSRSSSFTTFSSSSCSCSSYSSCSSFEQSFSWSSESSLENTKCSSKSSRGVHHLQYSKSCTDISRERRAFESDEDTMPLLDEDGNGHNSASTEKYYSTHKKGKCTAEGTSHRSSKPINLQEKKTEIFRRARSMEVLPRHNSQSGEAELDEKEMERRKEEARKSIVKEKMKFSAFLNEITRQVLSPSRLQTLGVTDAHRATSPVMSSVKSVHKRNKKCKHSSRCSGSADSVTSSVLSHSIKQAPSNKHSSRNSHSNKKPHSRKHHHHHHHQHHKSVSRDPKHLHHSGSSHSTKNTGSSESHCLISTEDHRRRHGHQDLSSDHLNNDSRLDKESNILRHHSRSPGSHRYYHHDQYNEEKHHRSMSPLSHHHSQLYHHQHYHHHRSHQRTLPHDHSRCHQSPSKPQHSSYRKTNHEYPHPENHHHHDHLVYSESHKPQEGDHPMPCPCQHSSSLETYNHTPSPIYQHHSGQRDPSPGNLVSGSNNLVHSQAESDHSSPVPSHHYHHYNNENPSTHSQNSNNDDHPQLEPYPLHQKQNEAQTNQSQPRNSHHNHHDSPSPAHHHHHQRDQRKLPQHTNQDHHDLPSPSHHHHKAQASPSNQQCSPLDHHHLPSPSHLHPHHGAQTSPSNEHHPYHDCQESPSPTCLHYHHGAQTNLFQKSHHDHHDSASTSKCHHEAQASSPHQHNSLHIPSHHYDSSSLSQDNHHKDHLITQTCLSLLSETQHSHSEILICDSQSESSHSFPPDVHQNFTNPESHYHSGYQHPHNSTHVESHQHNDHSLSDFIHKNPYSHDSSHKQDHNLHHGFPHLHSHNNSSYSYLNSHYYSDDPHQSYPDIHTYSEEHVKCPAHPEIQMLPSGMRSSTSFSDRHHQRSLQPVQHHHSYHHQSDSEEPKILTHSESTHPNSSCHLHNLSHSEEHHHHHKPKNHLENKQCHNHPLQVTHYDSTSESEIPYHNTKHSESHQHSHSESKKPSHLESLHYPEPQESHSHSESHHYSSPESHHLSCHTESYLQHNDPESHNHYEHPESFLSKSHDHSNVKNPFHSNLQSLHNFHGKPHQDCLESHSHTNSKEHHHPGPLRHSQQAALPGSNKLDFSTNTSPVSHDDQSVMTYKEITNTLNEKGPEFEKIIMLQEQNEDLHNKLQQTVECMKCLGAEFITEHHHLESKIQRTRVELSSIMDKFRRLQVNNSPHQQTESKTHCVAEWEKLNQRISELTKQSAAAKSTIQSLETIKVTSLLKDALIKHFKSDEHIKPFRPPVAPPPVQFMDSEHYNNGLMTRDEQSLGPVPEEEESEWSEMGEERKNCAFSSLEGNQHDCKGLSLGQWVRADQYRRGDGDTESESGGEEMARDHGLIIPLLRFTMHPETITCLKQNSDGPIEDGYHSPPGRHLDSTIRILSASQEGINSTGFQQLENYEQLKCTKGLMDNAQRNTTEIWDENEEISSLKKANSDGVKGPDSDGDKTLDSMANLESAQKMLNHFIQEGGRTQL